MGDELLAEEFTVDEPLSELFADTVVLLLEEVLVILPNDNDLVAQLSGRKYFVTENSKIRIESKEAVKKRGRQSPDEADCVLLLCLPVKPKKGGKNNVL